MKYDLENLLQNHTGSMAQNYDSFFGNTEEDIPFYRSFLSKDSTVIEFAVGTGRLAVPIAKEISNYHGVDLSPEMLELCRSKANEAKIDLDLHLGDMRSFKLEVKGDLIICACRSFMHNLTPKDQLATLQNFKHHLAPGGRIVVCAWNFDSIRISRYRKHKEVEHPYIAKDGKTWKAVARHHKVDELNQIVHASFANYCQNKFVDENEVVFRWITPPEFDLLAKLSGLKVIERYGDFEKALFKDQEDIIWVLEAE